MVINGEKDLILKCSNCGKEMSYSFNFFKVMRCDKIEYVCSCGNVNCMITRKKDGRKQDLICFFYGQIYFELSLHRILIKDDLFYHFDEFRYLFLGDKKAYKNKVSKSEIKAYDNHRKANDKNITSFNMLTKALVKIYCLHKNNEIICGCDNPNIKIDLTSNGVIIKCLNCDTIKFISIENEEDLNIILKKDNIVLEEHNTSCISVISKENKRRK